MSLKRWNIQNLSESDPRDRSHSIDKYRVSDLDLGQRSCKAQEFQVTSVFVYGNHLKIGKRRDYDHSVEGLAQHTGAS